MIVEHAKVNWENFVPKVVKILILGSFNPNNPVNNTNYYYGRYSNFLWKAIGDILFENQQHFFVNGDLNIELAKDTMEKYQFCFLDLISDIKITGHNVQHEINFKNARIDIGFSDSVLFTTKTNFQGNNVNIERNYNQLILDFINENSTDKIIHTLGNNRISVNFITNPIEAGLGQNGFQGLINQIVQNYNYFEPISYSPSGHAVNAGGSEYYNNLKSWLQINLNL
jgi:hypothetical protein